MAVIQIDAPRDACNAEPGIDQWTTAVASERAARSARDWYEEEVLTPIYRAHDSGDATLDEVRAAESVGIFSTAHTEAVNAVILTPARDLAAVAFKIDLGVGDHAFDGSDEAEEMLKVIASDIRRIAGVAA